MQPIQQPPQQQHSVGVQGRLILQAAIQEFRQKQYDMCIEKEKKFKEILEKVKDGFK